jgi:hypothetical protein
VLKIAGRCAKIVCAEFSHFIFGASGYIHKNITIVFMAVENKNIFSGRNKFHKSSDIISPTLREQQTAFPAPAH